MSQAADQDRSMADATSVDDEKKTDTVETDPTRPGKITVLLNSERGASYQFDDEDHTLGNALRYIIMRNPDVEFCGYSIPHPSENKMNLRIQTYDDTPGNALRKGLKDLQDLCDVLDAKFKEERDRFDGK